MADKSVWEKIAEKIKALPEEVEQAFLTASKQAINEEGDNLKKNLVRGGRQAQFIPEFTNFLKIDKDKWEQAKNNLENNIYTHQYPTPVSYTYEVDWNDTIVNEDIGVKWGRYKNRKRGKGKRNYSKAPATYHDLAYILSEGRGLNFSENKIKVVQGTGFIRKAWRNAQKYKQKQEQYFQVELDILGNRFDEDK